MPTPAPAPPAPAALGVLADHADDLAARIADFKDMLAKLGMAGYDQDLSDANLVLSAAGSHLEDLAVAAREDQLRLAFGLMDAPGQLAHLAVDHHHHLDPESLRAAALPRLHADFHRAHTGHVHPDQGDGPDA
jgi:hypothetical protein